MTPLTRLVIGPLVLAGAYGALRIYKKDGLQGISDYVQKALASAGHLAGKLGEIPTHISVLSDSDSLEEIADSAKALRETLSALPDADFANLGLGSMCNQLIHGAVVRACTDLLRSLEGSQELELTEASKRMYTSLYWLGLMGHKFEAESTESLRKTLSRLHSSRKESAIAAAYETFSVETALTLVHMLTSAGVLEEFKTGPQDPMPALFVAKALGYEGILVKPEDFEARFVAHYYPSGPTAN